MRKANIWKETYAEQECVLAHEGKTGWLSPAGEFFPCKATETEIVEKARQILKIIGVEKAEIAWICEYASTMLSSCGWIHMISNCASYVSLVVQADEYVKYSEEQLKWLRLNYDSLDQGQQQYLAEFGNLCGWKFELAPVNDCTPICVKGKYELYLDMRTTKPCQREIIDVYNPANGKSYAKVMYESKQIWRRKAVILTDNDDQTLYWKPSERNLSTILSPEKIWKRFSDESPAGNGKESVLVEIYLPDPERNYGISYAGYDRERNCFIDPNPNPINADDTYFEITEETDGPIFWRKIKNETRSDIVYGKAV